VSRCRSPSNPAVTAWADGAGVRRHLALVAVLAVPLAPGVSTPAPPVADVTATYRGGTAARLRTAGDVTVPGEVFELLGVPGLDRPARVWDATPYPWSWPGQHADSAQSNADARSLVEALVGDQLEGQPFTTPSGGGTSVGLPYTLGYLNLWSDGGFTSETWVAATGRLESFGWIDPVAALDEKFAAAVAAEVDVVFTPTWPDDALVEEHGARQVGLLQSNRVAGASVAIARDWVEYRRWGAERQAGMVDLVGVRHVGDVAAYLCGTGSEVACDLLGALAALAAEDPAVRPLRPAASGTAADHVASRPQDAA
jgi:hypothetical protein